MLRVDELEHGGAHGREAEQRQRQRGEHRRRARPAERRPRGIGDAAHVADRIAERHDRNEDRAESQQATPADACAREQPGHCDQCDAAEQGSAQREVASGSALQQEQTPGRRCDHEAQQQRQRRACEHLLPVGADPTPDDVVDLVGGDGPEEKDREERDEHDLHAQRDDGAPEVDPAGLRASRERDRGEQERNEHPEREHPFRHPEQRERPLEQAGCIPLLLDEQERCGVLEHVDQHEEGHDEERRRRQSPIGGEQRIVVRRRTQPRERRRRGNREDDRVRRHEHERVDEREEQRDEAGTGELLRRLARVREPRLDRCFGPVGEGEVAERVRRLSRQVHRREQRLELSHHDERGEPEEHRDRDDQRAAR